VHNSVVVQVLNCEQDLCQVHPGVVLGQVVHP
jgi:hypothetical protein